MDQMFRCRCHPTRTATDGDLDRPGLLEREFALSHPNGRGEPKPQSDLPPMIRKDGEPGWADGLRRLYNSVVDEPLPDSFDDILKKLDESDDG